MLFAAVTLFRSLPSVSPFELCTAPYLRYIFIQSPLILSPVLWCVSHGAVVDRTIPIRARPPSAARLARGGNEGEYGGSVHLAQHSRPLPRPLPFRPPPRLERRRTLVARRERIRLGHHDRESRRGECGWSGDADADERCGATEGLDRSRDWTPRDAVHSVPRERRPERRARCHLHDRSAHWWGYHLEFVGTFSSSRKHHAPRHFCDRAKLGYPRTPPRCLTDSRNDLAAVVPSSLSGAYRARDRRHVFCREFRMKDEWMQDLARDPSATNRSECEAGGNISFTFS